MASDSEKTSRIKYLCLTMGVLGLLWFLYKANACTMAFNSWNAPPDKSCHDEFYEIKNETSTSNYKCTQGARVEVVLSPPAPKPGVLCRCINSDAGSSLATTPGQ
jgi:hypothetical protein